MIVKFHRAISRLPSKVFSTNSRAPLRKPRSLPAKCRALARVGTPQQLAAVEYLVDLLLKSAGVLVLIAAAACQSSVPPYVQAPTGPTIQTPTRLVLSAQPGVGVTATQALITASVLDQDSRGIPQTPLSFATSHGTLAPINLSTNASGTATTTLTSGVSSRVTVAGAGFTAAIDVPISAPLSVSLSVRPPEKGQRVELRALVTPTPTPPMCYTWAFGDGATAQTDTDTTAHVWADDGPVTISVSVTDALDRTGLATTTITIRDNPEPPPPPDIPPPPPAIFTLAVTCATQPALRVDCNAVGSFAGVPLPSASLSNVGWDWGDGVVQAGNVARVHVYPASGSYPVFVTATSGPDTATAMTTATAKP